MNFFDTIKTLNSASAFELFRLRAAINRVLGFLDREQQQRIGKVIRLNDKTVTLQCDKGQWRVAYSFLHRVVDVDGMVQTVDERPTLGYGQ